MNTKLSYLPYYFNYIGIGCILASVIIFLVTSNNTEDYNLPLLLLFSGLFMINVSKFKNENTDSPKIREKAYARSFYLIIGFMMVSMILNYFLNFDIKFFEDTYSVFFIALTMNIANIQLEKDLYYKKSKA